MGVRALPDQPGAEDVPGPGDRPQPPQGGPQQDTQDCPTARTISQVGGEETGKFKVESVTSLWPSLSVDRSCIYFKTYTFLHPDHDHLSVIHTL